MIAKVSLAALLVLGTAVGQAPPASKDAAPARPLAFDVVSIRQNQSPPNFSGPPVFGPTADGYHMVNMPLAFVILSAYEPQGGNGALFTPDRLQGMPDWVMRDRYDVSAKVSDEDLAEWQKPAAQKPMLQAMLQAMLADRCKMAVHREMKDASVYLLVVGKNGPKFKESDPADPPPPGVTLPGGAVVAQQSGTTMKLYRANMGLLTTMLTSMASTGRPIQDKTGLTGKYDIVIQQPDMGPPAGGAADGASAPPDRLSMVMSVVEGLGLKLESSKGQTEMLVIDHIEKPSDN